MAANVNTLKATIERYRKEIDALRGQLKTGQQYLNEQRARVAHLERTDQAMRTALRHERDHSEMLRRRIDDAGAVQRLCYLFTGSL